MKSMILAAGLGTRLWPLTNTTPKPLIPLNGRPLIYYAIALLKKHGITDILINLHHLGEKIEAELGDGRTLGVNITYSEEPDILGTGGGIKKMAEHSGDEDFWVLNSDVLSDINLTAILREHKVKSAKATMVLRPHPILLGEPHRPTALIINGESKIISTASSEEVEKRLDETPFMFTGIHLINPSLLEYLPDGFSCIFKDAYRPAIEREDEIFGVVYDGYWQDLGTMEAYERTDRELREGRANLSYMKCL